MEPQTLTQIIVDAVLGIAAFFGAWILNSVTRTMERLDTDVRDMPKNYISKEDYHRDLSEIKQICKDIFNKLDSKADWDESDRRHGL